MGVIMAKSSELIDEIKGSSASIDAKSIDYLSRGLVLKAIHENDTVEGSLTDFLAHVLSDENLPRPVKVHAVAIGHKALDVARMIVAADMRKGAGRVQ